MGNLIFNFSMLPKLSAFLTLASSLYSSLFLDYFAGMFFDPSTKSTVEDDKIVYAMVGDSITYGYGSSDPATKSYPAQFAKLLGNQPNIDVHNFGVSGRTMMKTGDYPYWNEQAYKDTLASRAKYLVLMLGTNDAKTYQYNQT